MVKEGDRGREGEKERSEKGRGRKKEREREREIVRERAYLFQLFYSVLSRCRRINPCDGEGLWWVRVCASSGEHR